jgi:DNA-binding IclR family transcriptional regulator
MAAPHQGVESVERALSILKAFDDGCSAMKLAELSRRTGFYKSTILRLAATLEANRFLLRDEDGLFRLGPELWRLGALYRRSFDLGAHLRPALEQLVEATGETASFYIRQGEQRICLYRKNSPHAARHHLDEGVRLPLDRGAAGHVLVAFGAREDPATADIRRQGYAVSLGERDPDTAAAAVPLFDQAGTLRGALAVSGLLRRFDADARQNAVDSLLKIAGELTFTLPVTE